MILPVVRHNLGIGFIPAELVKADLLAGTVFEIKVEETMPERDIILIYDTEDVYKRQVWNDILLSMYRMQVPVLFPVLLIKSVHGI